MRSEKRGNSPNDLWVIKMRRKYCDDLRRLHIRDVDFTKASVWQYPPPAGIAVSVRNDAIRVVDGAADFQIKIQRTWCNYGGTRPWFLCPKCGDRRAVLYDVNASEFGCRRCLDLHYTSDKEDKFDRLM